MDLVAGVRMIIVVMDLCANNGSPTFITTETLPLIGRDVVEMIVTYFGGQSTPDRSGRSNARLI